MPKQVLHSRGPGSEVQKVRTLAQKKATSLSHFGSCPNDCHTPDCPNQRSNDVRTPPPAPEWAGGSQQTAARVRGTSAPLSPSCTAAGTSCRTPCSRGRCACRRGTTRSRRWTRTVTVGRRGASSEADGFGNDRLLFVLQFILQICR